MTAENPLCGSVSCDWGYHAKDNGTCPLKCWDFPRLTRCSNLALFLQPPGYSCNKFLRCIGKKYVHFVGTSRARVLHASLINYGQTGRRASRHKDRHLCSIVRGVITFMAKKGGHPERPAVAETDRYNGSTISVGQSCEREWSLSADWQTNNKLKLGMFLASWGGRCMADEVKEMTNDRPNSLLRALPL